MLLPSEMFLIRPSIGHAENGSDAIGLRMISAIILAEDHVADAESRRRAVARSLSALVPLVVGDIVADATIVGRANEDLSTVEQREGCGSEYDDDTSIALKRAAAGSRRDRLLVLRAGYAPDASFADEVVQAIENDAPGTVRIVRAEPITFLQRIAPRLAPAVALVAPRSLFAGVTLPGAVTLARLARTLAGRPMRARAIRV